ncbi:Orf y [Tanacetum coccineum]
MIRLHALNQRSAGTNALVVLKDTRWEDSWQIIGTMEVDLSAGTQLVYMFPDMVLSIDDFHNHVKVAIQTHIYDTWHGGESNLLVTIAMIGRLSNTSYMGFQYSMDNVVDHLTTTGITTMPGERRSVEELEGTSWNLKPSKQTSVRVPSRVAVIESLNRSLSLQFERYRRAPQPARYSVDQHDQEILAKRGGDHTILHLSKDDNDDNLPYPKFQNSKQMATKIIIMGPSIYPPARQDPQQFYKPDYRFGYPQGKSNTFSGGYDPCLWSKVISIWESITINRLNNQTWSDNKAKLAFVENLLGENPYRGSTDEQDRAYRDLDRITCEETKNLWSFLEDFRHLAIKSRKLYFPSTTGKLFSKLPHSLSKKIEGSFKAKYPGLNSGVLPVIKFTHTFVSEMCKDVALAKELRDLSLCSAIPILGYYENNRKKYGMRKSRTHKGKPHNSHDCRSKQGNIARSGIYQELDLDDNWDIVSADFDDNSVYSISEGECDTHQINVKGKQPHKPEEETDFSSNEVRLLKELLKEKIEQVQQMIKDQAVEYYKGKIVMKKKEELWQSERSLLKDEEIRKLKAKLEKKKEEETEVQFSKEEFPPFENSQTTSPFIEAEAHISETPLQTTTIIDTGASTCCINKKVVPEEALEPLTQFVFFNGLNSRQQATHRLKQGSFLIEGNKFKIPLIYAFDMHDNNGIEILIGDNFLRSMKRGIRIEGDEITIYKKVTKIKTSDQTKFAKIAITELKHQGYIGAEPLKHWKKNGKLCKLDIINPDITIEDRPLKHVTQAMEDSFRKHVNSLLKIGAIRPSKRGHRTMAMIVNSGATIDLVSGKEINGKERMVFNYKSLKNNTYKDQYSLPGINTIIKIVGGAKIFSKFDLKSGFHKVAMAEESIPWTAFLVLGGLYEWLVMPFGLKNALVNEKEHARHLERMLKICEDNGLVLSPTKMKIAVRTIDFLGAVIEEGAIKLQPRNIKKIVSFNEEELKTKNRLRSFLGILNYARNHIPKLRILLRPLYEKTNAHGDKRPKPFNYELVRKIKTKIQNLPDLEIPLEDTYIILEIDGCMKGWGGIVKWKNSKEGPRSSEKICAYASGEMKQLTAATVYSVEEVLQSHYASQKNMKNTCEEVMKIFNHF